MTSARPVSVGIRRGFLIGAALFATVGLVVGLVTRMTGGSSRNALCAGLLWPERVGIVGVSQPMPSD
jgi:hypothetical protein